MSNLLFYLGFISFIIFLLKVILRFCKPSFNLYKRYGGGWAVVTGGSDGIGLGFCEELAKLGFNICIISRNTKKIDQVCGSLKLLNNKIQTKTITADFSNSHQQGFYQMILKSLEGLEISLLINNVGVLSDIGPFIENTQKDVFNTCTINMLPTALLTRYILPKMLKRQTRSGIICLSSYSIQMRLKLSANYCATKLFNDSFSRSINHQYGQKVDFLSLKPGLVTTQMSRNTNSILHVNRNQCAKGALKSLGRYSHYAGAWQHQANQIFTSLIPQYLRDIAIATTWNKIGEKFREIDNKNRMQS